MSGKGLRERLPLKETLARGKKPSPLAQPCTHLPATLHWYYIAEPPVWISITADDPELASRAPHTGHLIRLSETVDASVHGGH